jgi:predicted GTPase
MSTQITTIIDEILQKRKVSASEPKRVKEHLEQLELRIKALENMRLQILAKIDTNSNIKQELSNLDLKGLLEKITKEQELWENLYKRFMRDTLNIGVAGRTGQGKSTLLQQITGLTDEIPSKAGQPCTSVQSNIYHSDERDCAEVHFYSQTSFLEEIIRPYYQELGFTPPMSLKDFRGNPLPPKPANHPEPAKADSIYQHLQEYYNHFDQYARFLQTTEQIIKIQRGEIKNYVSQEYEQNKPINFKHLAVRRVDIFCRFPHDDVAKIGLVDTIGLGDTRLGDTQRLIQALAQDIDFILFLRYPEAQRYLWEDQDIKLYNVAFQSLQYKLPLEEWSFMLLNCDGTNAEKCKGLENTRVEKGIKVKKCLTANCNDKDEAKQVLTEVLSYLTNNIVSLDKKYMSASYEGLKKLQNEVNTELEKARNVLEQYGDGNAEYVKLREEFIKNLYDTIEQLRSKFREEPKQPDEYFKTQVDAAIQKCNQETGIPSGADLESLKNRHGSYAAAYAYAIHQMRPNLLKHFHPVEMGLKESLEKKKTEVAEVLINKLGLGGLTEKRGTEFLTILSEKIPSSSESLKLGFQFISSFQFLYKGMVQSYIWRMISELLPSDPNTMPSLSDPIKTANSSDSDKTANSSNPNDSDKTANSSDSNKTSEVPIDSQTILTNLQERHQKAVEQCKKSLDNLASSLSKVGLSMVEEFADHITRAAKIEQEWDIFLSKYRSQVWTELKELEQREEVTREWLKLIDEAVSINLTVTTF